MIRIVTVSERIYRERGQNWKRTINRAFKDTPPPVVKGTPDDLATIGATERPEIV